MVLGSCGNCKTTRSFLKRLYRGCASERWTSLTPRHEATKKSFVALCLGVRKSAGHSRNLTQLQRVFINKRSQTDSSPDSSSCNSHMIPMPQRADQKISNYTSTASSDIPMSQRVCVTSQLSFHQIRSDSKNSVNEIRATTLQCCVVTLSCGGQCPRYVRCAPMPTDA